MPRKMLIFGNGLGMALDPEFFSLDRAIGRVWNSEFLEPRQKRLIASCLPGDPADRPHGEEDMDTLHIALSACDVLKSIGNDDVSWLSEDGQQYPKAVRGLFFQTAKSFHEGPHTLPEEFLAPLAGFVGASQSHIATLNYDSLIYAPMIARGILQGYDGALCDGFHDAGFAADNLERCYGHTFGYYLHLHGSPLFVDRGDGIFKLPLRGLAQIGDTVSSHIVLTHVKHKVNVIASSPVLDTYWQFLVRALQESNEVVMLGYSGLDLHLNGVIRMWARQVPLRVVEWSGAGPQDQRERFWNARFGRNDVRLVQRASILEFHEW